MDDHKIEVFLTTVRCGSFTRAAEELHCSQSAITQSMSSMEKELGCRLLKRHHSGVVLTSQGEALMPLVLETEDAMRRLRMEATSLSEAKNRPIRIGTYSSVANTFLPALIRKYQEIHPEASFQIRIGCDSLNRWLLEDEVDLILADEQHSKGTRWYPLLEDPYMGVLTEDLLENSPEGLARTDISQDEFFRLPFIMASNNNYRNCIHQLPSNHLNVVCDDDSTLVHMVAQGLGAALLPQLSIINPPPNVKVLSISPEFHRIIGLATPGKMPGKVQRFVAFVLEEMGDREA